MPAPPQLLPGDARAAQVAADRDTWIVGVRPGRAGAAIARRHDARRIAPGTDAYLIARPGARRFAAALRSRGLLVYSEPNRSSRVSAVGADPLSPQAAWRDLVAPPALDPPLVTPESPLLAVIDSQLDVTHPELAGSQITADASAPANLAHGTATMAAAAAPVNGVGMVGVWPGMRAVNVALPDKITCAAIVRGIGRSMELGATVINMSFGSQELCFAEFVALQLATARGVVLVAAAGNELTEGNPLQFPASLPHVLTVAAITPELEAAYFSNANAAIDLGAPGVGIVTAVPLALDGDGTVDGFAPQDGTSFAAPMVAAAATWIRAARPELSADQVRQVVRLSARDLGRKGWDQSTGFGLLDVAAALVHRAPPVDPLEPNEDIVWVDGRAFDKPDTPIFDGRRPSRVIRAFLDQYEDPADVYRVKIPAGAAIRITVKPTFGDADLAAFDTSAKTTESLKKLIDRSNRNGSRRDSITLSHDSRRAQVAFVQVYIDPKARGLDAGYELTLTRSRQR